MTTDQRMQRLGEIAAKPTFRTIDGVSIRFDLHDRRPHSELRVVDAGHFIWEDAADEYAELVNAW
jgi:pimeloyl-ACP methyl ester carboxylesterase